MVTLVVNFGGPRTLDEIEPFLVELLTDRDVVRTRLPPFFHRYLFRKIAKKRSLKIRDDYEKIGGGSPIYFDTETIARELPFPTLTFHRYLPATHAASFQAIESSDSPEIRVLPLFPQFSYATTGSIARLLSENLTCKTLRKLRWIKSYSTHPAFLAAWMRAIAPHSQSALLFSAHGLPRSFICQGDPYATEVEATVRGLTAAFPNATIRLSYQSKFGPGAWLQPATEDLCRDISWAEGKPIAVVPISFTSDHIETLFEIEHLYLPLLREQGAIATRISPPSFTAALAEIAATSDLLPTQMLIRHDSIQWCCNVP